VKDAVAAHDGQGAHARDKFLRLPRKQQEAVLAFIDSL
jgi:CxxC motif-containing protein (DUF1111 family)